MVKRKEYVRDYMIAKEWKVYLQVYKMQIIKCFTYKFEVYGNILMQTVIMLANAFFWKALFKNSTDVQGIDVHTMLVYTVISSMISVVLTTNVERRIMNSVEKGTIAIDMMRPVNVFSIFFAENLASVTALLFQNVLPIFIIGSVLIGVPVVSSKLSLLFFLVSLLMAFFINWFLSVIFGMISFTAVNMDALIQLKKHLIRLLSGSIIPIWFFPEQLRQILEVLPFAYLYQLPLDIYIGKYDTASLVKGLSVQCVWMLVLIVAFLVLQRKVTKKIMIQGG